MSAIMWVKMISYFDLSTYKEKSEIILTCTITFYHSHAIYTWQKSIIVTEACSTNCAAVWVYRTLWKLVFAWLYVAQSVHDHAEHWQLKPGAVGSIPPSNCWLFPFCLITSYFEAILRLVQEEQDYLTPWNTSTNFMDSTYLPAADESSLLTLFLESFLGWGGFNTIERNSMNNLIS